MNALSLYVTTTRMLFQADIDDSGAWNDINRLMSYLRQSLTCCVCGNLLYIPMSSTVSSCQHHVCKSCVGGKMRLKPSCSWCKDHSKFIENIQLRILLQCYKQLASFILSSSMVDNWGYLVCETNQASYSSLPNNFNGPTTFRQLLEEGSNFHDKYTFSEPPPLRSFSRQTYGNNHHNYNLQNPLHQQLNNNHSNQSNFNSQQLSQNNINSSSSQTYSLNDGESKSNTNVKNSIIESSSNVNNTGRINSITSIGNSINIVGSIVPSITLRETMNGESPKTGILLKANPTQAITFNRNIIKADQTQFNKILTGSLINSSNNHSPVNRKVRRGCRCGLATPNPGKLTCCGQRCPCYVESKACNQCKCRGCRNPNKVSNLTTINIISSGSSSSSSTTTTTTATSTSMSVSTSTTPSTASSSKPSESSSIISIPAGIASNLFQIPIVNNESIVKDICNNQVLLTTNLEAESLIESVKNSKDLTF